MIKTWLAKLITIKATAALAATAAGGIALAASTGTLPNPLSGQPVSVPGVERSGTATPHHAAGRPSALPSPALTGLCHAYTAGAGAQHGKALSDPAFSALIRAAGGPDNVKAFCARVLGSADAAAQPSGSASPSPTGDVVVPDRHPAGPPSGHPSRPVPSHPGH